MLKLASAGGFVQNRRLNLRRESKGIFVGRISHTVGTRRNTIDISAQSPYRCQLAAQSRRLNAFLIEDWITGVLAAKVDAGETIDVF